MAAGGDLQSNHSSSPLEDKMGAARLCIDDKRLLDNLLTLTPFDRRAHEFG